MLVHLLLDRLLKHNLSFPDRSVGILKDSRSFLLMEQSALEHDDDSFVHIYGGLLNGLQEPDLGPLQLQKLHLSLLLVGLDVLQDALLFSL